MMLSLADPSAQHSSKIELDLLTFCEGCDRFFNKACFGESAIRPLGSHVFDNLSDLCGNIRIDRLNVLRSLTTVAGNFLASTTNRERHTASQHEVKRTPQTVNVRAVIDGIAIHSLFW